MPEMLFRVRWPDETVADCYSPSRAITDHLDSGVTYSVAEFLHRVRAGLNAASERVRQRYGQRCSRAAAQLDQIEQEAARHDPAAPVVIEAIRGAGSPFA